VGGVSAWFTNSIGNAAEAWAIGFVAVIVVIGLTQMMRSRRRRAKEPVS
jgi:flagellar biosynthesis/type III secretory pathway M-ring protein FliF/YscJ